MSRLLLFALLLAALQLRAQETAEETDSTRVLEEVVVEAYQSNRAIEEVPASIGVVDAKLMNRFANTSFVSASNTIPGVRMEERSPGSYRFSIRGSLLRSPFGVRNVKFYWRGLPFTDGGGNTYLNLLDFSSVSSMEIIKGPGSSIYGAGTGGTVLLKPQSVPFRGMGLTLLGGSYGTYQALVNVGALIPNRKNARERPGLQFNMYGGFNGTRGYRDQTSMGKFNGTFELARNDERSSLKFILLSAQLSYETPGGLTRAQFDENPRQARPGVPATPTRPAIPGAVEQKASIRNNTLYSAITYERFWNDHWSSYVGFFASSTDFTNPAILNYEQRNEGNLGARAAIDYYFGQDVDQKLSFGVEGQRLSSQVEVSANNQGSKGALVSRDDLVSNSAFAFVQADFQLPLDFYLTMGGSANFLTYDMERTHPVEEHQIKNFEPGFFPRVALLKKFYQNLSAFINVSTGFSAPTFAEVLPNTGIYNNSLSPEQGTSYEGGLKGSFFKRVLQAEVAVYNFALSDAIVNVSGGDDFQNAGLTSQRGIETTLSWLPKLGQSALRLWTAYSFNNYHFTDYVRAGTDYSGNELTGVPRNVLVSGVDVTLRTRWYLNATSNFTDRIPLNDQNSEYAPDYLILGARAGRRGVLNGVLQFDIFLGVDNALNQNYSLGNDLNAVGGRYYNAAPGRSFYFGVTSRL
jgi:iron complex outermembrane receptor protein